MKKTLVSGADGFIGSHLTELLVRQGYKVKALSQYNSFNSWGWLENIDYLEQVEVLSGNIHDPHYCKHITKDVDVIFHLAALIAIPYSYQAPDSYVDTNIKGTLNICQAALENGVKRVIHSSTSEVYGTAQYVPIDENHPLQPQSPYSASKIAADAMAMSFYSAFNLPLTIARPFNTYGPRQSARAVIPTIITQIAAGEKSIQLGDISPTRDFNYVEDTCRGFLALAECDEAIGQTVNIASNYEISVGDTLNLIRELMNSDVEFITDEQRNRKEYLEPLAAANPHALENIVVNWLLNDLFPLYKTNLQDGWTNIMARYLLLRTISCGVAGHQQSLTLQDITRIAYRFGRGVSHSNILNTLIITLVGKNLNSTAAYAHSLNI